MSISELKGKTVTAKLWIPVEEVESEALTQIRNIASLPAVVHVAIMPDVHFGKGATVGSVIAMREAICPSAVGVDIGCGMAAVKTNLTSKDLPDELQTLRNKIEKAIPVGFEGHGSTCKYAEKSRLWKEFRDLDPKVHDNLGRARSQMGSLGGGNHFIEICLDKDDNVWIMLHSGSRNMGKVLAEIHIGRAMKLMHNQTLVDRELATFLSNTKEMQDYRRDLYWAQKYAKENREVMLLLLKDVMKHVFPKIKFEEPISCHHNYVSEEIHFGEELFVTRKGAISAKQGQLGIIPGSMGTKSFIVRGLGNEESLTSASHGAGRRMSRGKAKRSFTLEDLTKQTEGVECKKDFSVLDEIPGAYKDIDQVMMYQSDLVEVVTELKQILCVKG